VGEEEGSASWGGFPMSHRVPFWSDKDKTRTLPMILPDLDGERNQVETLATASNETLEALLLAKMNTARHLERDIAMLTSERCSAAGFRCDWTGSQASL
jgi:hypothetical protein